MDLTGKPAAVWRKWTRAPTLGRSPALSAMGVEVQMASGGCCRGWSCGRREKCQSLAPMGLHHLWRRMELSEDGDCICVEEHPAVVVT